MNRPRRRHTDLMLLLLAGQQQEHEQQEYGARAPDGTAPLDRLWSAAAEEGLVSPTPPALEPALAAAGPARRPARPQRPVTARWWRAAAAAATACVLAVTGAVVWWDQANQGNALIQTDIPNGDTAPCGTP